MKIILLRHEERYEDPTFFTELTSHGKMEANSKIIKLLSKHKNDHIYCSPFLRTIQTVYPYCLKLNKKINIEYSLYEYVHSFQFNSSNWKEKFENIPDDKNTKFSDIIDQDYVSLINVDDIQFREDSTNLLNRTLSFIKFLISKHKDSKDTILLVTHMAVINSIKFIFDNTTSLDSEYPCGHIESIRVKKNMLF